jgi:lipopolysaccharide transport system permease protein
MGVSFLLASLNVYYRDINQIWDIILQAGFFLTPIIYSETLIPSKYLSYYMLNPVSRIIVAIRKILYYNTIPSFDDFLIPLLGGLFFCLVGYQVFRRLEPRFAEVI